MQGQQTHQLTQSFTNSQNKFSYLRRKFFGISTKNKYLKQQYQNIQPHNSHLDVLFHSSFKLIDITGRHKIQKTCKLFEIYFSNAYQEKVAKKQLIARKKKSIDKVAVFI